MNAARTSGGGGVYLEEGEHVLELIDFKSIQTRPPKREICLVTDFRVVSSDNPDVKPGAIRNDIINFSSENYDPAAKAKEKLLALSGLSESLDAKMVDEEDWNKILDAALSAPQIFLGRKINCTGVRILKKDPKKAAKADPSLLDDAAWFKKNSYVRLQFRFNEQEREKLHGAKPAAPASGGKK